MISSGATSISANNGTTTNLITGTQTSGTFSTSGTIVNSGAVDAAFSVDGGTTWACLAATSAQPLQAGAYSQGIVAKGNGGTATGLSAVLWQGNVA